MSSEAPTRLVQLIHPEEGRRVALVDGNELHFLASYRSAYSFAKTALEIGWKLRDLLSTDLSGIVLDYEETYRLATPWRFLPSFDHFEESSRCLVSAAGATDGQWCYLGLGTSLQGYGVSLPIRAETAEHSLGDVAAVYLISADGTPRRVGLSLGAVFSGSEFPTRCNVLGPELILDPGLPNVSGSVSIFRDSIRVWSEVCSSENAPLLYALAAVEPDLFRYSDHHRPGDAHVYFIGSRLFGSRKSAPLRNGDHCEVSVEGLGKPLVFSLKTEPALERRLVASPL